MLLAAAALLAAGTAHAETYAIQAGRVVVDAAKPALGPSTILVENGRIARILPGAAAPAGAIVVDERSRTVMPGMTDVHVHLTGDSGQPWYTSLTQKYSAAYGVTRGLVHAKEMARAGFTTVRDLGGDTSAVIAVRDAVRDGAFPGPRVFVSGAPLSIIGGHADPATGLPPEIANVIEEHGDNYTVCTGVLQCQTAVRKLAAAGVDVIKFMATGGVLDPGAMGLEQHFTDEEMKAICDMSHAMHLKCAAHAHGPVGIRAAIRAGVDSIEHGTFIDDEGIAEMKKHGTYYSATLMAFTGVQTGLEKHLFTPAIEAKGRSTLGVWGHGLNKAYRAGVHIALGTDSAVAPHSLAAREVGLMVSKGGMTPRDALIAATKGGPDLLGVGQETGTLDPGKSADLIAVDGDPLSDPAAVTRVGYVMVMGKPIPMKD
ncbi:metal-dependent hydrolase family protein [Sphingomonas ginkgonis]|nr:amidohydrolase family protein [Sphingomonas ginkgonis]